MTREEAAQRAAAAEKRRKHEYYMEHREHLLKLMKDYSKRTRSERTIKERECRRAKPLHYAEYQLNYWTKRVEEGADKQATYNMNYWKKKVAQLKGEQK